MRGCTAAVWRSCFIQPEFPAHPLQPDAEETAGNDTGEAPAFAALTHQRGGQATHVAEDYVRVQQGRVPLRQRRGEGSVWSGLQADTEGSV